ncbi:MULTISPECIES: TonB-dependent receptor [Ramlibacter]|uniref:TonB-dependent receptor n=1 Tax=Ramlibacter aquaticus TaxID=2780094 RepID=A0ABR9SHP6_9BURK|nr:MULTISPECIES: TonB-dependent receptor [Ramlibacter]MBE7941404.1 TonB-dependent receptor [Ramlibacter aquaticus]
MTTTPPAAAVLLFLALQQTAAHAQDEDRVHTLQPVEVIHRTPLAGLDVPLSQYPGNAQQADDAAIERAGAATLGDFLSRRFAGVASNEVQGNPYQVDLTYRGQRLSPVLGTPQGLSVWFDGVRINQPLGDVVSWDLLPEAAIASVALVPGSNPLYGLNTLGGAIVLSAKSGWTHPGTEAEVSAGSFGRRRVELSHGRRFDDGWHAYVAASRWQEDGWRDASRSQLGNLYLKAGRQQGEDGWSVSLLDAASRLGGNGLLSDSLAAVDRAAFYTGPDSTRAEDRMLTLQGTQGLGGGLRLSLLGWHREGTRDALTGDIDDDWRQWLQACAGQAATPACSNPSDPGYVSVNAQLNRSHTRQSETGIALQGSQTLGPHQLAFGVDASASRIAYTQSAQPAIFDAARLAQPLAGSGPLPQASLDGRVARWGAFAAAEIALARGTQLSASLRWDTARTRNTLGAPDPQPAESFRYGKLNPGLGLTHALSPRLTAFASAMQGTRVPTALELGCADPAHPCVLPTGLQSDPYLKPVVARTLEAGLRAEPLPALKLSGAVFHTASRDDIVFLRSSVSQAGYFANVDRTRRDGAELGASWKQGALELQANASWLRATYGAPLVLPGPLSTPQQPNQVGPGSPIAGMPRQTLKLSVDWRATPVLALGLDLQANGSQVVAGNEGGSQPELGRLPGFALLHARARWKLGERLQAWVRVANLTDRRSASFASGNLDLFPGGQVLQAGAQPAAARFIAPGAPRSFAAGLRYEWDD